MNFLKNFELSPKTSCGKHPKSLETMTSQWEKEACNTSGSFARCSCRWLSGRWMNGSLLITALEPLVISDSKILLLSDTLFMATLLPYTSAPVSMCIYVFLRGTSGHTHTDLQLHLCSCWDSNFSTEERVSTTYSDKSSFPCVPLNLENN